MYLGVVRYRVYFPVSLHIDEELPTDCSVASSSSSIHIGSFCKPRVKFVEAGIGVPCLWILLVDAHFL